MDTLERYRDIIPDFDGFLDTMFQPLPTTFRINTLKTDCQHLLGRLDYEHLTYLPFKWYPHGLKMDVEKPGNLVESLMGYIHSQEEISMVSPVVLKPRPEERVLDLCAAPGSKTTQIAQMMNNRGLLVANEPVPNRIVSLRSNCERLGVMNVVITRYDGRFFPLNQFDRVLVDAPCTGQGMARKDLSVLSRWNLRTSLGIGRLQLSLLKRAITLTKSGGEVVYSTCTFAPEENEAVVSQVLNEGVKLEEVSVPHLKGSPGLNEWMGTEYGDEMKKCARYYPHQNDTGGFFVAKLIKE